MKKCKYCGIKDAIKYSKYTNGDFCSKECARGFSSKEKRKEINEKVSKKLLGRKPKNHIYSPEKWKQIKEKRDATYNQKIIESDYNTLSEERLRKRVILEQNKKCNKCGSSEWLGQELTFELEHKDGNHHNNKRENVEALCPNCHSLSPTWRGKNKKNNKNRVKDEILFNALIEYNFNMRQALFSVGLAGKGGNYKRCHKLKREFEDLNMEMLGAGIPKGL